MDNNGPDLIGGSGDGAEIGAVLCLGGRERPHCIVERLQQYPISRQRSAAALTREVDLVILMDDGGGAAQSLYDVCSNINDRIHRVRSKEEIRRKWFDGVRRTAIISGILVPQWTIDEIARHVRAMFEQSPA